MIVRAGLFAICGSSLLSLLPLLAKQELGLDSVGFGLLLGSFGIGAIISGNGILPKIRSRASSESIITSSIGLLAIVIFAMGYVQDFGILCLMMGIGGISYTAILSTLYTTGMKTAPKWIGARALAVYLLILNGGLAVGSVIWGDNIHHFWNSNHPIIIIFCISSNNYCWRKTLQNHFYR